MKPEKFLEDLDRMSSVERAVLDRKKDDSWL
jgi:hypothetical protein